MKYRIHYQPKRNIISRMLKKLSLFVLLLQLSSCYTVEGVNYLQTNQDTLRIPLTPTQYKVQPSDILNIKVQSRDPDQSAFFNSSNSDNRNIQTNPAALFLDGYTISREGTINLPIVGELEVSGLTIAEITELVQSEIDKYLLNAIAQVKLTSFKISVLGDVKNPGTNYVYNAQSTIFEALSAAGDMNLSAKRKDVKLIRQIGQKSTVVNLDLTSPFIINSPYYFLHPNDVIYVETSKPNLVRNNIGIFTLVLSAISTGLLILNFATN